MELTRRNFIGAGAVALAGAAAAGGLAGCSSSSSDEDSSEESTEATDEVTYAVHNSGVDQFAIAAVDLADAGEADASVDWLVIGGGNAGLFAAARGADLGMSTILLEKNSVTGGAGVGTEATMMFSDSDAAAGIEDFCADKSELYHYHMMHNVYKPNAALVANYFAYNKEVHNFLLNHGAVPMLVLSQGSLDAPSGGIMYEDMGAGVVATLLSTCEELGVDVRTSTPATALVTSDGAVVGAMAEGDDGEIFIEAKAVCVATGGFGTNADMVHFYIGLTGDIASKRDEQMGIPHDGDGICMMFGAGAIESEDMDATAPGACAVADVAWDTEIDRAATQPYLWVNYSGKRVGNEKWNTVDRSYKMADREPTSTFWTIFDSAAVDQMTNEGFLISTPRLVLGDADPISTMPEALETGIEQGIVYSADTIEELAEACGINAENLVDTVARYNEFCAAGEDTDFYKDPDYLIAIDAAPYYAIEVVPSWYATLNGVKINDKMEVVNSENVAIPGLYAAGADASEFFKVTYNHGFGGSDSAFSYFGGYFSAENALEYIGTL